MKNFSYGKCFYNEGIFDIETKEDIVLMKKAISDAEKVEEYYSTILPNIDRIRPIIVTSFKLNKNIDYKDRINYVTGIIYSKRYIDMSDVLSFANDMATYTDPEDKKSIFFNKGNSESIYGFFEEAFDEDLCDINNIMSEAYNHPYKIENKTKNETEEDVIASYENSEVTSKTKDKDNEESLKDEELYEEYLRCYYDVTPLEKLENFQNNFKGFIEEMLYRNHINPRKNNRRRTYIIKGMEDWYNYVMGILEEAYEINRIQKDYNSLDLTKFV